MVRRRAQVEMALSGQIFVAEGGAPHLKSKHPLRWCIYMVGNPVDVLQRNPLDIFRWAKLDMFVNVSNHCG